jgi:hypothetical protein
MEQSEIPNSNSTFDKIAVFTTKLTGTHPLRQYEVIARLNKFSSGDAVAYLFGLRTHVGSCLGAFKPIPIQRDPHPPAGGRKTGRMGKWACKMTAPLIPVGNIKAFARLLGCLLRVRSIFKCDNDNRIV